MKKAIQTYERICKIEEKINEDYEEMTMKQQKSIKEREQKAWDKFTKELQTADDDTISTLQCKYGLADIDEMIEA